MTRSLVWSLLLATALSAVALLSRPLLPIDETRYLTVAWESHQEGNHLVSHLNGETYAHKPPLLFWLINAVWKITGVSGLSARIIGPAAGICCLILSSLLARRLWPDSVEVARSAPVVLVSSMLWMIFFPLTMFDTLLTLAALLALLGTARAADGMPESGWLLAGLGMGLGILAKGPVILVHVLPVALAGPWWSPRARSTMGRWYAGLCLAIVMAAIIGLSWALPSAAAGGEKYGDELLYGQTAGRMVQSFAHQQKFWWYLPLLPACLVPWVLFAPVWRGACRQKLDPGLRFVLAWIVGSLTILSLVSGKQIHYIIPVLPACALAFSRLAHAEGNTVVSRRDRSIIAAGTVIMGLLPLLFNHIAALDITGLSGTVHDAYSVVLVACGLLLLVPQTQKIQTAIITIATSSVVFMSLVVGSLSGTLWNEFDLKPLADFVAQWNRPVGWFGEYHGQINFIGKIPRVKELLTEEDIRNWVRENPNSAVILRLSASEGSIWTDILPVLEEADRSQPNLAAQRRLARFLGTHPEFPLSDKKPHVLYVQWMRRGLKRHPCLVVTYTDAAGSGQIEGPENNLDRSTDPNNED
jgi:4-amino-4-deoxy-L-arabinose transferase-like glycosyltransferase